MPLPLPLPQVPRFSLWPWPWIFKVKYGICYYLSQKWSNCHETKSKHIDWTLGLKCDHWVWPRPWPWHDLDLEFSWSNMEFAISQSKMVRLPWNEKQTYQLNWGPQMWPLGLTLAMTLTFQGQIGNLLYLRQKWSDCHEMKSKHIDWNLGLKMTIRFDLGHDLDLEFSRSNVTDLYLRQHTWLWPRIFMVKFLNSYLKMWRLIDIEQRGWE